MRKTKKPAEVSEKPPLCAESKTHMVAHITLRGKNDSYYVHCAHCNYVDLVAVWFEALPQWGLDALNTLILHEAFYRLVHVYNRSITEAQKTRKRRKNA